jgi:hypothetical protein
MEDHSGKRPAKRSTATHKPAARSRVGNGKALLAGIDQRSLPYREYQDAVADLVHHMGDYPTATEQAMIEEAAGLIVWCRAARLNMLHGEKFDIGPYTTAVNSLRRLLVDLGLEQRMLDVTEDIVTYAKRVAAEKASATDAETSDG